MGTSQRCQRIGAVENRIGRRLLLKLGHLLEVLHLLIGHDPTRESLMR
jgi:hypothetical protein